MASMTLEPANDNSSSSSGTAQPVALPHSNAADAAASTAAAPAAATDSAASSAAATAQPATANGTTATAVTAPAPLTVAPPSAAVAAAAAPSSSPSHSGLNNAAPQLIDPDVNYDLEALDDPELDALRDEIYSLIRHIRDPEHPYSIEQLGVVYKSGLVVEKRGRHELVDVEFRPTVPHCSLATLIGLCIRTKVVQAIPHVKFSIRIKEGAHNTAEQIDKQLNDKERATAALENPVLRDTVERLIKDDRAYE